MFSGNTNTVTAVQKGIARPVAILPENDNGLCMSDDRLMHMSGIEGHLFRR